MSVNTEDKFELRNTVPYHGLYCSYVPYLWSITFNPDGTTKIEVRDVVERYITPEEIWKIVEYTEKKRSGKVVFGDYRLI